MKKKNNIMDRKIKAILIDVDGCLLSTNGDVSSEYYEGLAQISRYIKKANQEKFPIIGFCSGRDRNYIEAVSFFVGLPNSWSVVESGVILFNPATKELIFNPILTDEMRVIFKEITDERIPKILKKYPQLFLYPGNIICVALERKHQAELTIEDAYKATKEEMADLLQDGLLRISHSDCAVDISPVGIDKASGLQFLSQHTGINLKQALGIGDSNGDFPLFEQVGYIGCPANASKECKDFVKKRKGYISPYCYAEGVNNIIKHFVKKG